MNIQEGSYYIARNGELVGPMVKETGTTWFSCGLSLYKEDGTFGYEGLSYSREWDITDTVDNAARKHVEGN